MVRQHPTQAPDGQRGARIGWLDRRTTSLQDRDHGDRGQIKRSRSRRTTVIAKRFGPEYRPWTVEDGPGWGVVRLSRD